MIEHQVNITKDGYNMQIDIQSFAGFYKRLGWQIVGRAPVLPMFDKVPAHNVRMPDITDLGFADLNANQRRLC